MNQQDLAKALETISRENILDKNLTRRNGLRELSSYHVDMILKAAKKYVKIMPLLDSLIEVAFIHPPIPIRDYDWLATYKGDEGGLQGWGKTKEGAIEELKIATDEAIEWEGNQ